jgi:hypothetical protein
MTVKFITIKGQGNLAATPFYVGVVQHEHCYPIGGIAMLPIHQFAKLRGLSFASSPG